MDNFFILHNTFTSDSRLLMTALYKPSNLRRKNPLINKPASNTKPWSYYIKN